MNGGGRFAVVPRQIFVSHGPDLPVSLHLDPYPVFDPLEPDQLPLPLGGVGVLDHHRCFPVAAIRNQRIIGVQLVLDAAFLKGAFDPEHFLDLVAHGQFVLEDEGEMLAQCQCAALFVGQHAGPEFGAASGIDFEGEQAVAGNGGHGGPQIP